MTRSSDVQAQSQNTAKLVQFDLMTAESGWILLDRQLFWTSDAGGTWEEIGPSIPSGASIQDVEFKDEDTGWVLWTTTASDGNVEFQLAHTMDHGTTWTTRSLSLFEPGDLASNAQKAEMGWFDAQTGWIAVKQNTGSNFSIGVLFTTADSGITWSRFALPAADRVYFRDPQRGWAVGQSADNQLFETQDAGRSWEKIKPVDLPESSQAITDPRFLPEGQSLDKLSASIAELDMVSLEVGWAKSVDASCVTSSSSAKGIDTVSCSSVTRLLQTTDGGLTWQVLNLPLGRSEITSLDAFSSNHAMTVSAIPVTENTLAFVGQGFDKCEIPALSQMQTWWNSGPYRTVNLYIGGANQTCANSSLSSSYLFRLSQQGWRFIPTWVGPQAPCTGYPSRMNNDPAVAFSQGVSEANLAVERLSALGLTSLDQTGSVVYYDIEPYGTDTTCRAAVNSFMNGWVSQLHARGSLAGVYGSTLCNTGLNDFQTIMNMPDLIWPARWYHNLGTGFYDPNANVWNLGSCVPNSAWSDHQRIRQYEGDHNETWGGLTLAIDSDVLDGVVASLHGYPFVDSILRIDPNPTNAATVGFTINFSEAVTGVNQGDFVLTTTGVAKASIQSISGSGATYSVIVNTGSGDGTIRLDLVDNNTIVDNVNDPLGGIGSGNGKYTEGEIYTVNKSAPVDSTGVFRPSNGLLYLKNTNTTGIADVAINYGLGGDYPVVGDWDGNGTVTIGVYRNGQFMLRNSNTLGFAEIVFPFGAPGDQPIAGDWDGNGTDTIGVYRPSIGQFLLRNDNSEGPAEMSFFLGNVGDVGLAGDWDGDGLDTTGVFRPSNGVIFLKDKNASGFADVALNYGIPGDKPVTGDWDNDGIDTIGVYRNGQFMLRNENTNGFAEIVFGLGNPGDMPIAGNWDGLP